MSENIVNNSKFKTRFLGKRKWVLNIFLVVAWAFIQFFLGNKIIGIFVAAYFLKVFLLARRPYIPLLISFVLAIIILFTPLLDAMRDIRDALSLAVSSPGQSLKNVFSPNSGQEVLQRQVRQTLSLIKDNSVEVYRLSDQINADSLMFQRIIESAWPVKNDGVSPYLITLVGEEKNYPFCGVVDQRQDVVLEYCP